MLVVWSGADTSTLKRVIAPVVTKFMVEHRVVPNLNAIPPAEPGDVILVCGPKALELLQALKLYPKNRTIGSVRESMVIHGGIKFLVTYDPRLTNLDYARHPEIQWDVQLACRVVKTGTTRPILGQYRWVESFHELIEKIEDQYEKTGIPVNVASDLECKGLDEYNPRAWIISIFFTVESGFSDGMYFKHNERPTLMDPWDEPATYWDGVWNQINWLLTSSKVSLRGANWKFDSRWLLQKWGIDCSNHRFDTTLVGSLLDENRSNSLKLHAKILTSLGGYEDGMNDYDMGFMELVPMDKLVVYAGGDTDATYQVADEMKSKLLEDKRLAAFYVNLLHPSGKTFERMERNGIPVDVPYYNKLKDELVTEIKRLEIAMLDMIPHKLRIKHMESISEAQQEGKSPFLPKFLKEYLFTSNGLNLKPQILTEKTGEPSTAKDHLMMFIDNPIAANFINLFKGHGSASKTLTTYVIGFLKHLRSDDKFHPSYMLFRGDFGSGGDDAGAVTGRTSCQSPAVQTIPKRTKWTKRLRRAFVPPSGMNIVQLDFSQGELRIAAVVAEEPTMLDAYANGLDLHSITAASLNGYEMGEFMLLPDDIRDDLRSHGKAGNFGLLYGMGANGFKTYAYTAYGVSMSEVEAFDKREAFFGKYTRLLPWHREAKNYAKKWGFIRSPLGRVRHLPLINVSDSSVRSQAERQAINSPIQATLSDMMQLAMVHIDREYGQEVIQMFLMCHDSCAFFVPLGDEIVWAKRLKTIMENLPLKRLFGWDSPLKFPVDAEMGIPGPDGALSLAYLKKIKGL